MKLKTTALTAAVRDETESSVRREWRRKLDRARSCLEQYVKTPNLVFVKRGRELLAKQGGSLTFGDGNASGQGLEGSEGAASTTGRITAMAGSWPTRRRRFPTF